MAFESELLAVQHPKAPLFAGARQHTVVRLLMLPFRIQENRLP